MLSRILVFPCGSEIGLEIHNSLQYSSHIELFGGSSTDDHGAFVYKNYIHNMPYVADEDFIEKMNQVITENKIDFIFPAHDDVGLKLAENQHQLKCQALTSDKSTCQICRSKERTYEFLHGLIPLPKMYNLNDEDIQYPVFLKPPVGQGSKGVHIAKSKEELHFYLLQNPSLLLLEYLPGREYTVDCFTDRYGKLRFVGGRERKRIMNGISVRTSGVNDSRFNKMAEKINEKLSFHGVWFFQVKEASNGELVLMEVAPRVAGSMGLYRNLGVNLPLLTIYDALKFPIHIMEKTHSLTMDRALTNRYRTLYKYKHVYIDLDDTILIKEDVNWLIIAFIYQCINKNIKIHLLSKHEQVIENTLKEKRIIHLFDSVIQIPKNAAKSGYIKNVPAIFIDDSFSERLSVSQHCKVPVFDLSEIESLIDWRR